MIERWRCFVAVPLPNGLRSALADVLRAWRDEADGPDVRWSDPAGWHVTLAFLGWIDAALVEEVLSRLLEPAAGWQPAQLSGGGLGTFPSPRRARVLWYALTDEADAVARLAAAVQQALAPVAPRVQEGSPFRPHVTLARARAQRGSDLSSWIADRAVPAGVVPVDRVILYRSHLGNRPAQYEALGAVTVGTGARIVHDVEAEASVHG